MYLLDTSVVSELAKPRPNPKTVRAFNDHFEDVRLASVVLHEIRFGIERLPDGKRKDTIRAAMDVFVDAITVLPYDAAAGEWHACERARLEQAGRVPAFADGLIAATAAVHDCTVVTANPKDFRVFSVSVETWS
jgi:tRNA(fMet)-specific endonuclease VapC